MRLTDGRVTLRDWEDPDASFYVRAARDPEIQRWTTEPPDLTEDGLRRALARRRAQPEPPPAFVITDAVSGEPAGNIALAIHDPPSGMGEAMYWVAADFRGRGLASAALRLLCGWAFVELGLRRIELVTDPENAASRRVAEAAGFEEDGTVPPRKAGRPAMVRYALTTTAGGRLKPPQSPPP
jgi:[ribosomal protein S5]-alanine N-acetyltransferase